MTSSISDPPLADRYGAFLSGEIRRCNAAAASKNGSYQGEEVVKECDLPLIDVGSLFKHGASASEKAACVVAMARASAEWGFFQVVNHGVGQDVLAEMGRLQRQVFSMPFGVKSSEACNRLFDDSYRWGNPTATCLRQFSWSEAFHIPLSAINGAGTAGSAGRGEAGGEFESLRAVMRRFAAVMSRLGRTLMTALADHLGGSSGGTRLADNCGEKTCFLRLNRYPPCSLAPAGSVFGLTPHTDSDFLTILHQDAVGGLQLRKGPHWVAVRPNPQALIVNIGDLFQAWSNDVYKSVEHKVVTNGEVERFSIAYFMCPSYDAAVGSCREPSVYKNFTFGEFRRQVQDDVKRTGQKVGLPRFRLST